MGDLSRFFEMEDMEHFFLLEPLDENCTRFRQVERFHGPMVLFMDSMIKQTEKGYHQMNFALKQQIEESNER